MDSEEFLDRVFLRSGEKNFCESLSEKYGVPVNEIDEVFEYMVFTHTNPNDAMFYTDILVSEALATGIVQTDGMFARLHPKGAIRAYETVISDFEGIYFMNLKSKLDSIRNNLRDYIFEVEHEFIKASNNNKYLSNRVH